MGGRWRKDDEAINKEIVAHRFSPFASPTNIRLTEAGCCAAGCRGESVEGEVRRRLNKLIGSNWSAAAPLAAGSEGGEGNAPITRLTPSKESREGRG